MTDNVSTRFYKHDDAVIGTLQWFPGGFVRDNMTAEALQNRQDELDAYIEGAMIQFMRFLNAATRVGGSQAQDALLLLTSKLNESLDEFKTDMHTQYLSVEAIQNL